MNEPTQTEQAVIHHAATALLNLPDGFKIRCRATGETRIGNRTITADLGPYDIGPLIGSKGGMKLAIQTVLAWPYDADACQLRLDTRRIIRPKEPVSSHPETFHVERLLEAIAAHLAPELFHHRSETSETAVVTMIQSTDRLTRDLRGPIAKLIRGIGRCQGYPAMASIELIEGQPGNNQRMHAHA